MKHREKLTAERLTYTVVFDPDPDGGFVVTCPALAGLVTHGATLAGARAMARDAIAGNLATRRARGMPIPASEDNGPKTIREGLTVTLKSA